MFTVQCSPKNIYSNFGFSFSIKLHKPKSVSKRTRVDGVQKKTGRKKQHVADSTLANVWIENSMLGTYVHITSYEHSRCDTFCCCNFLVGIFVADVIVAKMNACASMKQKSQCRNVDVNWPRAHILSRLFATSVDLFGFGRSVNRCVRCFNSDFCRISFRTWRSQLMFAQTQRGKKSFSGRRQLNIVFFA